jgi:phage terminase large subunit-like protein
VNAFAARLAEELAGGWRITARENQLAPAGDWSVWLLLAGRGFGKTRVLSEMANGWAASGQARRIAVVAPTASDARDVSIEGESGILACAPAWCRPIYETTRRRISWPNGAVAYTYSAEEPERLRGPQHDAAICVHGLGRKPGTCCNSVCGWGARASWLRRRRGRRNWCANC